VATNDTRCLSGSASSRAAIRRLLERSRRDLHLTAAQRRREQRRLHEDLRQKKLQVSPEQRDAWKRGCRVACAAVVRSGPFPTLSCRPCRPRPLHPTPYTLYHPRPCPVVPAARGPYTLHPIPYTTGDTLHPTLYTLYTLHPTPYTLYPVP